jgi:hypothetical protein
MQAQVWVPAASMIGVVLGGGLSYLTQLTTQRQANRNEDKRQTKALAEARRAEQLDLLRQFIQIAQRAERLAEDRDGSSEWVTAAKNVMDDLWACERVIHILFTPTLHEQARRYVKAANDVLWEEPADVSMWDYLQGPKTNFLDVARAELA